MNTALSIQSNLLPIAGKVFEWRDFRYWHITSFRRAAEFGRYRGIADFGKLPPGKFMSLRPKQNCAA